MSYDKIEIENIIAVTGTIIIPPSLILYNTVRLFDKNNDEQELNYFGLVIGFLSIPFTFLGIAVLNGELI